MRQLKMCVLAWSIFILFKLTASSEASWLWVLPLVSAFVATFLTTLLVITQTKKIIDYTLVFLFTTHLSIPFKIRRFASELYTKRALSNLGSYVNATLSHGELKEIQECGEIVITYGQQIKSDFLIKYGQSLIDNKEQIIVNRIFGRG